MVHDQEMVEAIVEQAWRDAGYTTDVVVDGRTETVREVEKFHDRVFDIVASRVANGSRDLTSPQKTITKDELYEETWPGAPGTGGVPLSDLDINERDARIVLSRKAWQLAAAGRTGHIQTRLNGDGRVLCRGVVKRDRNNLEGVFTTTNHDLIMDYAVHPTAAGLAQEAAKVRKHMEMILGRQRGLEPRVLAEVEAQLQRATAEIRTLGAGHVALPAGNGKAAARATDETG